MTVVQYEQPAPLPASTPGQELQPGPTGDVARLRAAAEYANYIAGTDFVPQALRGNPAAVAAAILAGAELGLQPMVALRTVAIIKGRPTLTAEAQRGLVTSAGHSLWFEESTVTRAIAAGQRAGEDRVGRVTWTLDDAKRAGIAGGENWRRYPAEMLRARASAALARAMFADVILGIPASEELEGDLDDGLAAAPTTATPGDAPAPATRTRQRKKKTDRDPVAPTPPPDDQPEPDTPPEPGATGAQLRQIFALMRDAGFDTDDRAGRLAYTNRIVKRELTSSSELTIAEAGQVIDDLTEIVALPAGDERTKRMLGAGETEVVEALDELADDSQPKLPQEAKEFLEGKAPEEEPAGDDDDIGF